MSWRVYRSQCGRAVSHASASASVGHVRVGTALLVRVSHIGTRSCPRHFGGGNTRVVPSYVESTPCSRFASPAPIFGTSRKLASVAARSSGSVAKASSRLFCLTVPSPSTCESFRTSAVDRGGVDTALIVALS